MQPYVYIEGSIALVWQGWVCAGAAAMEWADTAGCHVESSCSAGKGFLTACMLIVSRLVARQPPPSAATPAELELMGQGRGPGSNDAWQDESSDDDSDRVRSSPLQWPTAAGVLLGLLMVTLVTSQPVRGAHCHSGNGTSFSKPLLDAAFNSVWWTQLAGQPVARHPDQRHVGRPAAPDGRQRRRGGNAHARCAAAAGLVHRHPWQPSWVGTSAQV